MGGLTHWWAGSATAHGTGCAGPRHLPALQRHEMYICCMYMGLRMPWGPEWWPGALERVPCPARQLWAVVVGAVGRQGSLLHPLPPLASLCWQTLEDELFEIISPPGREHHGGVGGEEVRPPSLIFVVLQLQANPLPCTLPPLWLAPRALAGRETLHVTLVDHGVDGLDALGVVWSPHLT